MLGGVRKMESLKENLWTHFFKSKRKNYNPYMFKLLDYPEYIIYDKGVMNSYKGRWGKFFGNENPIYLEIGSGSGNFAQELTKRFPNKNHIALELRFKRLVLSANKVKRNGAKNIVFLRRRGEELLEFIGEQEIAGVYVNFPDPWEENEKNRVVQESFFKNLDKIMKKGGVFYFKTDHDKYYQDVLDLVDKLENYEVIYSTPDLHNSEKVVENIKTEFEQLFLCKHNKNINYIEITKIK